MLRLRLSGVSLFKKVTGSESLCIVKFSNNVSNQNTPSDDDSDKSKTNDVKLSGFAQAFEKHSALQSAKIEKKEQTFASLLRNSKFIDLGDPAGKLVTGKIFHVVNNDLYIDFGWKFYCVCTRPLKSGQDYVRGASVKLRIKELELSSKFLGATKDLTILEADCVLMGLINSPMRNVKNV